MHLCGERGWGPTCRSDSYQRGEGQSTHQEQPLSIVLFCHRLGPTNRQLKSKTASGEEPIVSRNGLDFTLLHGHHGGSTGVTARGFQLHMCCAERCFEATSERHTSMAATVLMTIYLCDLRCVMDSVVVCPKWSHTTALSSEKMGSGLGEGSQGQVVSSTAATGAQMAQSE